MASLNLKIDVSAVKAAAETARNCFEAWSNDRQAAFAAELNALIENGSMVDVTPRQGVLVATLSPAALSLLQEHEVLPAGGA